MAGRVTPQSNNVAHQSIPDQQPTHRRRNTIIGILFGAIVFSYAHKYACNEWYDMTSTARRDYLLARNACEQAKESYLIMHGVDCTFYNAQIIRRWDAPHCRDQRVTEEAILKIPESQNALIKLAKKTNATCEHFKQAKAKYDDMDEWRKTCWCNEYRI